MNVRELLQYEIWSKETSRKILTCVGIVFVSLLSAAAIEMLWVSPGELILGRRALEQVDKLQRLDPESKDFEVEAKKADGMVDSAVRAALTIRDKKVASALGGYLMIVELEPGDAKVRRSMKEFERTHPGKIHSDPDRDAERDANDIEVRRFMSATLHSALDYKKLGF